jgi:ATP phosphoribosyltransferase regulatory subunit
MRPERWLLPEGVQEMVPPESWRLESARRTLLDLYWRWGYDLIRPPLIEYLESLLTGAGQELDLLTFKLTDQLNGRMMGVRSDMTTQVTRIDAHRLAASGPARYCYIGSVLRTRPDEPGGSRSPLQIGAEKFGDAHLHSDFEAISLMRETLRTLGIERSYLDLGHVSVYKRLIALDAVPADFEPVLFDIVQRKSRPDLDRLAAEGHISALLHTRLAGLIGLNGSVDILEQAVTTLGGIDVGIDRALAEVSEMAALLAAHDPALPLYVDLSELRGYRYKTGLLFAAFAPGLGRELARGGRYDDFGSAFGRARPATGFSADLNLLATLGDFTDSRPAGGIFAPPDDDPSLRAEIQRLRSAGERVVLGTPDHAEAGVAGCDRSLEQIDGTWCIRPLGE